MRGILISILTLALLGCAPGTAVTHDGQYFRSILNRDGFDAAALSSGTNLTSLYRRESVEIVFYDNIDPESQHGMQGIIVFKSGKYSHFYMSGGGSDCRANRNDIDCLNFDPKAVEHINVSDLFLARGVMLGGTLSCARLRGISLSVSEKRCMDAFVPIAKSRANPIP